MAPSVNRASLNWGTNSSARTNAARRPRTMMIVRFIRGLLGTRNGLPNALSVYGDGAISRRLTAPQGLRPYADLAFARGHSTEAAHGSTAIVQAFGQTDAHSNL